MKIIQLDAIIEKRSIKQYKDRTAKAAVEQCIDRLKFNNYDERVKKLIIILESTLEEWEHQL